MHPCPQDPFLLSVYSKGNLRDNMETETTSTVEKENGHFVPLEIHPEAKSVDMQSAT